MTPILSFKDSHLGDTYVIIPKIREISKGFGSVIITFDNGEKRNIESKNPDDLLNEIVKKVANYYNCPT